MNSVLLTQTVLSGLFASAAIIVFLLRFAPRRARWPHIVAAAIFLDQASKWIVTGLVHHGIAHSYLGGMVWISYFTNYFQGFGAACPWLLSATLVGLIAAIRLYQMLVERPYVMSPVTEAGLALLLAGVLALALERAWTGYVVDFLQFGPHSTYVCNFADLQALGGLAVLFVRGLTALPGLIQAELAGVGAGGDH